ncbi:MAG: ATP-dependent 6-phosphofructokinase [Beduini sp.]|uniref:ATP-dependent 6-phosphofructokinase n=1 Tax=Beduini sp. TaxID=1922300 RepID=UPI0039A34C24
MMKKVAVLTSGGDAPGMNSVIHAICLRCANLNIEPIGVIGGFKGLYEGRFVKLHSDKTSQSASMGGTILKSSRFIEFKQAKYVEAAAQKAREAGIDGIIVIGGDGSYLGALALSKAGMPTIGVPGTIDNDISGTQFTIGFDSAFNTIVHCIDQLKDTIRSHERCLLVEVMGRHCSDLAVYGAISGNVDAVITAETKIDEMALKDLVIDSIKRKDECMIMISENVLNVHELAARLEKLSGMECRGSVLGYLQRGGNPSARDRLLAARCGLYAVDALNAGHNGECTCLKDEMIVLLPIEKALSENYHNSYIHEEYQKLR